MLGLVGWFHTIGEQCITSHGIFYSHVQLYKVGTFGRDGHLIYRRQRQKNITRTELCYFTSVWNTLSYRLVSIMLLLQNRVATISTVKFKMNNIAFNMKYSFEGHFIWNMNEIAESDYAIYIYIHTHTYIYIYIFPWFRPEQKCLILKDHVAYNQAKFRHTTTFG